MANIDQPEGASPPRPPQPNVGGAHWLERAVALAVAVWIVALLSFLILSQRKYDPTSVYFLKILLSFSMAILIATSAGFINLSFNLPGLAIRAGGAIAIFIFVFTQSPSVPVLGLGVPKIEMNDIGSLDFRSLEEPSSDKFKLSPVAITAPIEVKNIADGSRTGTLKRTFIEINIGGRKTTYEWHYFVRLLPGVAGTWLSSGEIHEAQATDLIPGQVFSREIMHLAQDGPNWETFLSFLKEASESFSVTVSAEVDGGIQRKVCRFDPRAYQGAIASLEKQYGRLPGYLSVLCDR